MSNRKIKLLITIVERGQGKKLREWYEKNNLTFHFQTIGHGTASSDLMDVLGFGSTERDVLLSLGESNTTEQILYRIQEDESEEIQAKGIAFSMPLTAMNTIAAAILLNKDNENTENGGIQMEAKVDDEHSLLMVVVNQGHTDTVMDTARTAGARGGTIIRSRWVGSEEAETFYGITLQAEKEIIFIVAGKERRKLIMETINKKHGMNTEAGAMICSVALDQIQRIG